MDFVIISASLWVNPLSRKSDQHQFSPKYINTLSNESVRRIYKMINKEEMRWSVVTFSQLILQDNVETLVWRICIWISGLKGLKGNLASAVPSYRLCSCPVLKENK